MPDSQDWTQHLTAFLETTVRITEAWAEHTVSAAVETADAVADELEQQWGPVLDAWAEEVNRAIEPLETVLDQESDRVITEFTTFITPVVEPLVTGLEAWAEAVSRPINNTVEPVMNDHGPCMGCRHYHGQVYGGTMFVCALYPYGPEEPKCPDWQSVWTDPKTDPK